MLPLLLAPALAGPAVGEDFILDEYEWFACTPPSDDTWIIRQALVKAEAAFYLTEPPPGGWTWYTSMIGTSMMSTVADNGSLFPHLENEVNPYEMFGYWEFGTGVEDPMRNLQGEFHYHWGDPWPEEIRTLYRDIEYTVIGPETRGTSSYRTFTSTFCDWDDRTYPDLQPEDCFIGWDLCISHLRPDRLVAAWTIDATQASRYRDNLPRPVMMVYDIKGDRLPFYLSRGSVGSGRAVIEYPWAQESPESELDQDWVTYASYGDGVNFSYYLNDNFYDHWAHIYDEPEE